MGGLEPLMILDELAGLLQAARFFPRGEPVEREALRALPELADGLPPVVLDARGPHVWSGCGDAVRAAATGLGGQLAAAARTDAVAGERELASDAFVGAVARLVVEGARHGPGSAVVPLLEAVRAAHDALAEPALGAVRGDPVGLRRVGAAVQARLAFACARANESARVPALGWAVSRSRLLPIYARGTLDRDPAWSEIAAVLEVPLPSQTLESVETAVRLAVRGIAERRAAGRSSADDAVLLLRTLGPARLDPGPDSAAAALLQDPDGLATLLPALARFVDAKALAAAGVDPARADRLLTPSAGLAVASVLVELLGALRTWDVLSQAVAAVGPSPHRGLGVPRATPTKAAVVAGRVRGDAAAEVAWDDLARVSEGALPAEGGLVVFGDAVDALRFALAARKRLPSASIALAWGVVAGGTDGRATRVSGPTVDAALRWVAGVGAARVAEGEPGGLRSVGGWLVGQGLAVDTAAAEAIQESRVRRGLATTVDGPPAGDARVPRSVDLHRAYDFDGGVFALVRIPGVTGGFEALHMPSSAWRALLDRDGERAAAVPTMPPPLEEPVAVATPAVAEGEGEGEGWEMAEADELPEEAPVTLDLGEATGEAWSPPAPQQGFEFDPDGTAAPSEDEAAFTGYYLPGADPGRPAPTPPRPAPASAFDMQVEDDDEETQEWGAPAAPTPVAATPTRPTTPRAADFSLDAPIVSAAPFTDDLFSDPFPVPEELRDPATPASSGARKSEPAPKADPFAADPFAGDPFATAATDAAPADPVAGDPFTAGSGARIPPAPAADPFGDDPFGGYAPPATAGADPFASAPRADARASAEPTGDPFSGAQEDRFTFPQPENASRPSNARAAERPSATLDFDFLLKGYACFFEKKEAVFGRPYGTRIVDRHVYPYSGDPDAAYLAFLQDKIREGFVPRADMMGDLPRGVTLMPLDAEKLQRAWKDLS